MKVTFFSNYLNHHQLPICLEFLKHKNIDFKFIATTPISKERLNFGYENMNKKYDFVLTTYDSKNNYKKALELGYDSDIVIIGSASEVFVEERLKDINKITFRYSERIFKNINIKTILSPLKNLRFLKDYEHNKKYYLLCSSAYSCRDFNLIGQFKNRCFKWGYFPKLNDYNIEKLIIEKQKNKCVIILWVARFLKLKHPEYCIYLAKFLNKNNIKNYKIKMIGTGELLNKINKEIEFNNLNNNIEICGSMSNNKVLEEMKKANIFIFTSDRREGWGAVLNESMSSGCAVVANKKIGSVPYLLKNSYNGLVYNNKKEFLDDVKLLIENKNLREKFSINAYKTINDKWNASIAVNNFLDLYVKINNNKDIRKINYDDGPCSFDRKDGIKNVKKNY